ncbi:uncharacterized protein DNG_10447 [Cephalotrichum gorgonifer]|uniref:NACHT domain-containing protein n=1 Tax=Cephalotrichum gorgonifer TaxID=2041049 RepID=A0AAE8N9B4_9PEZI|nr:uncharacterized protein DNG_10447 [Cephalotrichum gorgonifer]
MLARHPTTGNLVQKWAGCKKSVIAAHYFWTAGSAMQKSRQGFVQALLYDIFRSCPDLIPEMMPARWAKLDRSAEETADTDDEWTLPQLLHALQQLSCSPSLPARYCVIVDGIDEFDGDHFEMCEFLKTLSKSPNFKLCVSSRPWNVFEDAFGGNDALCRRLCIHELTQHDILAFAQSRMAEYPRWKEPDFSAEQMESIIKDITDRAHGVFLWVSLVTRSLREGLVNGDTVLDLRKRLESLPADLEAFFRHMMNTVDPLYHERMARVLRIAVNAKESLSLQFYYMREFEEEDTDYALNKPIEWFFVDQIEDSLEQCRRRINARCGGLLEVKDHRVEFLHRTVRDFLMTRDMSEYLREKSGSDFLVNLSTLKAFVFLFRFWFHSNMDMRLTSELPRWNWEQAIGYANGAIVESKEASFMLLDAVDDHYNGSFAPNDPAALGVETHHVFLSSLLLAGVDVYICAKLDDDDIWLFGNLQGSPICKIIDLARWDARHVRIITSLLESDLDCDINQEYDEYKGYDDEGSDGEEGSETESEEEEEQEIGTQKQRATVKNQIGESKVNVDSESVESEDSENRAGAETKGHDRDDDDVGPLSPWHRLLRRAYHEPDGNLFRAAVENSLFSTFLKHGARKDVRLKAPCWLPCTNVIMAMIRHVESHRFRSESIALLDDFLQGNSSDVKDQLEEVLKVIADELCEPTRQQREQRRLQFIAEILHRLIRSGIKNGVEMDCLVSRIRTSFPGGTGSILEDLIRHKEESRYFNTSKPGRHRKRKARGQNIGPEKRVRPK